jgi:plastocyanin
MTRKTLLATLALCLMGYGAQAGTIVGQVQCKGLRTNADAVVYIEEVPGASFEAPKEHVVMNQENMMFVPHVLPVLVGTTVDFLNSDAVLHNVFTPDKCAGRFNLGSWPQGQVRSYTFDKPCVAALLCNVHPEMEGFVVAVPTPYFTVTDKSGDYRLEDVPDTTLTVRVWHPKLSEEKLEVEVSGDSTVVDIELEK